ncbi:MAG: FKBP-type peptidyl-prolyl cis-trans isomerase [Prevotellaceae bacterium]|jgi:FKBP-type peptidyl-prolyl cis-trans isomerase|nr:FKBP-type peptidyl-prolyl cis-trans isomerase [Prevotellaceae bacterium]
MNWALCKIYFLLACCLVACHHNTSRNGLKPVEIGRTEKNAMIDLNRKMVEKDIEQIEAYIKEKQLPMQRYADGYYGMVTKQGAGRMAVDGSTLTLRMTIRLLNGAVCYKDSILTFIPGQTTAIPGLHQVAKSLQKGTWARYIFPPSMAYGLYGDGRQIPQRSILEYDIEVLEVQ